jgi:hypothetical protein
MKSVPITRPILRRTAARAFYLKCAAEWLTDRRQVPSAVIAAAERAARGVLLRHACQPKAHIKFPPPERGGTEASIPTNTPT